MKKQSFLMAGLLVLTSMAATQVARAQDTMAVDIPFAFTAGSATLPAGEYRVQKLDGNSAVLLIHCWDAKASALVITHAARQRSRNPNRSWSLTVTAIATSFRRSGRQDPSAEDNSRYRHEKKKCRNWLATRRKAKLRWLPACQPSGRD